MDYLALNTASQQVPTQPFVFQKRTERIDWRRIGMKINFRCQKCRKSSFLQNLAAIDLDRIARDLDFQALQDNITQITLCNIDMEVVSQRFEFSRPTIFHIAMPYARIAVIMKIDKKYTSKDLFRD